MTRKDGGKKADAFDVSSETPAIVLEGDGLDVGNFWIDGSAGRCQVSAKFNVRQKSADMSG